MEYRRAYWDEDPDPRLVERHEREIFPLLHRRYLFAGVENFLLYDFFAPEGHVNEDVFAYSNRVAGEKGLVVYHNKYAEARGWIRTSVAYAVKTDDGGQRLEQKSLGEGLALEDDGETFTVFRDHLTGLEYIRNNRELHERGLYVELGAYKCHVFLDFRPMRDNEWHQYAQLAEYLDGRGVPSIDEALKELLLQPLHRRFRELVNAEMFRRIAEQGGRGESETLADEVREGMVRLLQEIKAITNGGGDEAAIARDVRRKLEAMWQIADQDGQAPLPDPVAGYVRDRLEEDRAAWYTLCGWLFIHSLGKAVADAADADVRSPEDRSGPDFAQVSRSWIDEWLLGRIVAGVLQDLGLGEGSAWWAVNTIKTLTAHQRWFDISAGEDGRSYRVLHSWLQDDEVQRFLQVNRYQDVLWFNHEAFEQLLWWMLVTATVTLSADAGLSPDEAAERIAACYDVVRRLREAEGASEYRVERLLEVARD
jgi:hypothetical protein